VAGDTSLTVTFSQSAFGRLVLIIGRGLTRRKETLSLLGVESGFPAITEPPLDHEPLNRAARSGENLIEANHKVVTKAASTHANGGATTDRRTDINDDNAIGTPRDAGCRRGG